jgi:hypothetical protein
MAQACILIAAERLQRFERRVPRPNQGCAPDLHPCRALMLSLVPMRPDWGLGHRTRRLRSVAFDDAAVQTAASCLPASLYLSVLRTWAPAHPRLSPRRQRPSYRESPTFLGRPESGETSASSHQRAAVLLSSTPPCFILTSAWHLMSPRPPHGLFHGFAQVGR